MRINLGLADLHQLRGRVGRLDMQAYAYFIVQKRELQSEISRQRLKALEKHSDLGAGFHIAFEDLQIRVPVIYWVLSSMVLLPVLGLTCTADCSKNLLNI